MDVLGVRGMKCPRCGSQNVAVGDSCTIIDGSSRFKTEERVDEAGKFSIAFRPVYQGNSTKFRCKDCGANFEYRIRNDEVETLSERGTNDKQ